MADMHDAVNDALSTPAKKPQLRTEGVSYKRSDNGGFHAEVHKHHKKAPHDHHHTERHIIPNVEAMHAHMDEHMADQPPVAAGEPDGDEEAAAGGAPGAPGAPGAAPAAAAGGAAGAAQAGM